MSHWPGMPGQEWDIEASFRLRIMDYSPNRFLSLSFVLFLTWGTHTYIWRNFCLIFLIYSAISSNISFVTHPDITCIMNPTRANWTLDRVSESHETQKTDRNLVPIPTKSSCRQLIPSIHPSQPRYSNPSIYETPRECLQRPLSTM